jgi:4-hydroxybenzoate polyprenyltransferase
MADREDDLDIGVKSTAIFFAPQDKNIVCLFQITTQSIWLMLAITLGINTLFYVCWAIGCMIFLYQQIVIRRSNPNYLSTFSSNGLYGLIFWVALMLQT